MAANEIEPSRTALLLLDLQVMYAKMDPSFDALMIHTASVVKTARSTGITIAHCRVAFTEVRGRKAAFGVDSPEAAFHPSVAPEDGDIVVRKSRVGPFFNAAQDVHAIFKGRGIDTLLLAGASTGGAVAATVVQAADLDYQLFVVEESCADTSKETHEFLMNFFAKRATMIKGEELKTLVI